VVGDEAAGDYTVGDVGAAAFLDAAGGPLPVAVPVEEQGGHHDRVVGGPAFPVGAVRRQERGNVDLFEKFDQEIGEMVLG
jgi:hypothetical protein